MRQEDSRLPNRPGGRISVAWRLRRVARRGISWQGPAFHRFPPMPKRIFVLTGAGVSAESGLGTFRDKKGEGIWARFDPMRLATPEAFARDPETVLAFYDARRRNLIGAAPNAAHFALARLEAALAAMGGELMKARCLVCESVWDWTQDLPPSERCPGCGGGLRPHVVWFGEMPFHMEEIAQALERADLLAAIGTSGAVYPAAGFAAQARAFGIPTCEINLEAADNAGLFDESRYGPASAIVPAWADEIAAGLSRG